MKDPPQRSFSISGVAWRSCDQEEKSKWNDKCLEASNGRFQMLLIAITMGANIKVVAIKDLDKENIKILADEKLDLPIKELRNIYEEYNTDHNLNISLKTPR
ncbi:hypothetical protein FRC11_010617, partial [Ceratobasidium sp. 423]